jgi:hypothetical protein
MCGAEKIGHAIVPMSMSCFIAGNYLGPRITVIVWVLLGLDVFFWKLGLQITRKPIISFFSTEV